MSTFVLGLHRDRGNGHDETTAVGCHVQVIDGLKIDADDVFVVLEDIFSINIHKGSRPTPVHLGLAEKGVGVGGRKKNWVGFCFDRFRLPAIHVNSRAM